MDILLKSAPNFRGLGGLDAAEGARIRQCRLFRSQALDALPTSEVRRVQDLDIGLVCDLRSPTERESAPHNWLRTTSPAWITPPYSQRLRAVQRSEWQQFLQDPEFDERKAAQTLIRAYCSMPRILTKVLADLFEHCETAEPKALLVNCAAGKDRTGFVIALLLWALGVPYDSIMADYLRSREGRQPERRAQEMLAPLYPLGMPDRVLKAAGILFSVSPEMLDTVLNKLKNDYGSIDNYLFQGAGLTANRKEALQRYFLE